MNMDRPQPKFQGLSYHQYNALFRGQGCKCAICGAIAIQGETQIDHSHSTGVIRGLLCRSCNQAIGMMHDDPDRLEAAAKYLRNPPAYKLIGSVMSRLGADDDE